MVECNIAKKQNLKLWHERLGHINLKALKEIAKNKIIEDLNIDDFDDFFCDTCHLGKQSRKPHYTSSSVRVSKPGEIIHSDVCGPMNIESPSGSRYFILFKDDFSKYRTVYFMRHKSEALSKFKEFCAMVENQTGNKVKSLRTDNGREYVNEGFTVFKE
jgi:Integrase core domain.